MICSFRTCDSSFTDIPDSVAHFGFCIDKGFGNRLILEHDVNLCYATVFHLQNSNFFFFNFILFITQNYVFWK